jgi:hypothetical protein
MSTGQTQRGIPAASKPKKLNENFEHSKQTKNLNENFKDT